MAYTGYLSRIIRSCLATVFVGLAWAIAAPISFVYDAVLRFPLEFQPDAADAIALDVISRDAAATSDPARSRFKSFLERALSHARWTGDHFDPGRSMRLTIA